MDVLSEILSLTHVSGSVLTEIECRGEWAIDMLDKSVAKGSTQYIMPFHYMVEGEGYLLDGTGLSPVRVGDLVIAPSWPPHSIASDAASLPISIVEIIAANGLKAWDGGTANRPLQIVTGTGDCTARILSGVLRIQGHAANLLASQLPSLLKLSPGEDALEDQLAAALSFIRREGQEMRPGYVAVAERLTDLLFIQILRSCISTAKVPMGLLAALADKRIARALEAIHAQPAEPWTVSSLAERAYLSRTVFAERFSALVGVTPIQYVNRWRMLVAQDLILRSDLLIGEIQHRVGFSSSFAFSRAFRQSFGVSPSAYRKVADIQSGNSGSKRLP